MELGGLSVERGGLSVEMGRTQHREGAGLSVETGRTQRGAGAGLSIERGQDSAWSWGRTQHGEGAGLKNLGPSTCPSGPERSASATILPPHPTNVKQLQGCGLSSTRDAASMQASPP